MKRLALLAATAAVCALPASAMASPSAGVVLTVSSHRHAIQVVDSSHVVHAYRYRGSVQSVRPGSKVRFKHMGGSAIGQVRAARRASGSVTFQAVVTRATPRAITLRPADGRRIGFARRRVYSSATLTPGMKVLATELLRAGRPQALKIMSHSGGTQSKKGGSGGTQGSGAGAVDHSPTVSGPVNVNGTITKVSPSAVTITAPGGQVMQFTANPDDDVTDGYLAGDQVTVTYNQLADGALKASDVEYIDQDVTGTVTAVTNGSVTITVDGTGVSETLTDDPSDDMFDGVMVGDQGVDVTYHLAAAGMIVDGIDD